MPALAGGVGEEGSKIKASMWGPSENFHLLGRRVLGWGSQILRSPRGSTGPFGSARSLDEARSYSSSYVFVSAWWRPPLLPSRHFPGPAPALRVMEASAMSVWGTPPRSDRVGGDRRLIKNKRDRHGEKRRSKNERGKRFTISGSRTCRPNVLRWSVRPCTLPSSTAAHGLASARLRTRANMSLRW